MDLALYMVPSCVPRHALKGRAVVVIDALRMTSVAAAAFENGCRSLYAVRTIEEALAARERDARVLLGGERHGKLIPGFDLDNSPLNFSRQVVAGRTVCMTTTNGTQAIAAAQDAQRVLLGAFVNGAAVARALAGQERAAILCAGTGDLLSLEDVLAGGAIIARLEREGVPLVLDDAALAARRLYEQAGGDLHAALRGTHHYGVMQRGGQQADIDFCLREDLLHAVPQREQDGAFVWREKSGRA